MAKRRLEKACPECGSDMVLKGGKYGRFYGCVRYPACDAAHGAHADGTPLGVPADKETKLARIAAHSAFDKRWKASTKAGIKAARKRAYDWLREQLGLSKSECHIGRFDKEMCKRVIELCEKRERKMNEVTTNPYEDYRSLIPEQPKEYEVFLALLRRWEKTPNFYDIEKTTNCWKIEFKLPPREGYDCPEYGCIVYNAQINRKLDPRTGELIYELACAKNDMSNDFCRDLARKEDWKLVITRYETPLRGVPIGQETIWSYTEEGLVKIARVARDLNSAKVLKERLLAGEL